MISSTSFQGTTNPNSTLNCPAERLPFKTSDMEIP